MCLLSCQTGEGERGWGEKWGGWWTDIGKEKEIARGGMRGGGTGKRGDWGGKRGGAASRIWGIDVSRVGGNAGGTEIWGTGG